MAVVRSDSARSSTRPAAPPACVKGGTHEMAELASLANIAATAGLLTEKPNRQPPMLNDLLKVYAATTCSLILLWGIPDWARIV